MEQNAVFQQARVFRHHTFGCENHGSGFGFAADVDQRGILLRVRQTGREAQHAVFFALVALRRAVTERVCQRNGGEVDAVRRLVGADGAQLVAPVDGLFGSQGEGEHVTLVRSSGDFRAIRQHQHHVRRVGVRGNGDVVVRQEGLLRRPQRVLAFGRPRDVGRIDVKRVVVQFADGCVIRRRVGHAGNASAFREQILHMQQLVVRLLEFAIHNRQRKAEVTRVEDVVTLAGTNSNVVFLDFRRADEIVNLFCCNHAGDSAFIAQPVGVNA